MPHGDGECNNKDGSVQYSHGPAALQGEEGEADPNPLVVTPDELVQAVHVIRVHGREPRRLKGTVPRIALLRGDGDVTV